MDSGARRHAVLIGSPKTCADSYVIALHKSAENGTIRGIRHPKGMARVTGLEPATSGVTGRRSNQLSYTRVPAVPLGGGAERAK